MLYIHKLHDLNAKNAEIESIQIIRDLKKNTPRPITQITLQQQFEEYFVSKTQLETMMLALNKIQPAIDALYDLGKNNDGSLEMVNVERAIRTLRTLPERLHNNIAFSRTIADWQEQAMVIATSVLNTLPTLQTDEQRQRCNQQINEFFKKLNCADLRFDSSTLINEGHVETITSLNKTMTEGFLFHFSLEEHLKKKTFADIKHRIAPGTLAQTEALHNLITDIKRGIDEAYQCNMRLIEWAVIFYAYIRWTLQH